MTRVLVVATSRKTRGGITSVVKAHEQGEQWQKYHCQWIETHRDGNIFVKIGKLLSSLFKYIFLLPGCDLVHIHISEPPSAYRKGICFMPFAKLLGKKVLVHFHAFSPETTIRSKYKNIYRYLFTNADNVIVLSNYWKNEVEQEFPAAKVKVIYNPCQELTGISTTTKKKQILYAGTVNLRKGYADMVRAFALIADKHKDWHLTFAGNGEIEQGKALAKELGISRQTEWLGWVSGTDKEKAFCESMIFCLPSYAEGFPMAVLDAWSYGLPVITTPVGGIPDVAVNGENMLIFAPGDIPALADCIDRMISDTKLRENISLSSMEFANKDFNIKTINAQIGELYKEVLQKHS